MAIEVKMPQLSDTMHSGKILVWHKKVGDQIKRGDVLAEVETDKANLEIEAFHNGTLLEIFIPAESVANVGDTICALGEVGEKVSKPQQGGAQPPPPQESAPAPQVKSVERAPIQAVENTAEDAADDEQLSGDRIIASPLAKKLAKERNIDLANVSGSGPNGRIVKKDVDAAHQRPSHGHSHGSTPLHAVPSSSRTVVHEFRPHRDSPGGGRLTAFSKMRDTIARRMQQSVSESPHFYVTGSIRMEDALKLREFLKTKGDYKGISVNHFIIKACAYALEQEPRVNRAVREDKIFDPDSINIGIITSVEDGLLIPVIKEANTLPLKDIVFEARSAVERAKAGRPSSSDLTGGTFSISNMGMFDVENFTAIINPGQGAVLAVSAVQDVPVVENGNVVPGKVMKVTLSVDHRVIDGVMAATFIKHFKEALEYPALLMN